MSRFTPSYSSPYARLVARCRDVGDCWLGEDHACRGGYQRVNFRVPGLGGRNTHFSAHILTWVAAQTGATDLDELFLAYHEFRASGLQLDHTCVEPGCRRPDHLEPVTPSENQQRAADRRAWRRDNIELEPPEF